MFETGSPIGESYTDRCLVQQATITIMLPSSVRRMLPQRYESHKLKLDCFTKCHYIYDK